MMRCLRQFGIALFFLTTISARSQTVSEIFDNSGIWAEYGQPVSPESSPQFKGRLSNIYWSDIELAPGQWDWTIFDDEITRHAADNMPLIFMVYTKQYAPEWLFSNGVPKVNETDLKGNVTGYSPYYLDEEYNFYFKRMITEVRKHVEQMDPGVRNNIIGVQACFGSTGDRIAYKGTVPKQYEITEAQFDSLFKVYSLYYYNEYKNVSPAITMMTNADYQDRAQYDWIDENCPGGWMKCPTMGKGFQLNMEADKMAWLYDRLNKPQQGSYVKARCEISGDNLDAGWWTKKKYKNFFTVMTYGIYWGLDWPNMRVDMLTDPKFDSAFRFFNKYAGQKVPGLATNAMCALKDVLDASDTERFPEDVFGSADKSNKSRYINIQEKYISYGAKLEDPAAVMAGEYECLDADGTNDVGWRLLPGNYERYLHQIDANETSAGYWNVDDDNQAAMYGRFTRGFDLAKGKDALYFDVEDGFLRGEPLNGKYDITIEVTYYDNGNGSWKLFYDGMDEHDKTAINISCSNTKTWKKTKIVLTDAYFGNRAARAADFYIKSTGESNVIFSVIELSRDKQSAVGFVTSPLASFDTVCVNGAPAPNSFVVNAAHLDGTDLQAGPLEGYTFSDKPEGPFTNFITYKQYTEEIHYTIYVKVNTQKTGVLDGNIPVHGGGAPTVFVPVKATVLNTSPQLNADVTQISCPYENDGVIDLRPTGGFGPFTYDWTNDEQSYWNESTQDVSDLKEANYTVKVASLGGCTTTKSFGIKPPDKPSSPEGITGPSIVDRDEKGLEFSVEDPNALYSYEWNVPVGASITSGQNTSTITVNWGYIGGNVTVKADNGCNISPPTLKFVEIDKSFDANVSSMESSATTGMISRKTSVIPNPAKNTATLQFYAETNFTYSIQLTNVTGKVLLTRTGTATPGINMVQLNVEKLVTGYYFVTIIDNSGKKQTIKLLKE